MIEIGNLHKSFGKVHAVAGLSLTAADGEITGLIGPNGAGKTTSFRVVGGLMRPDKGHAAVDGFDTTNDRIEAQRRLGVLPDVRGLYRRLRQRRSSKGPPHPGVGDTSSQGPRRLLDSPGRS